MTRRNDERARWERRARRYVNRYLKRALPMRYHLAVYEEWWLGERVTPTRVDDQLDVAILLEELRP